MASLLSPWGQRIEQLVAFNIAGTYYDPDVSMSVVEKTLTYTTLATAKNLQIRERDIPHENPWVAGLMLYVTLGDIKAEERYCKGTKMEAGKYLGIALRAGWSIEDMLQAIEWNKLSMPHYPTPQQWASVFDVAPEAILAMQLHLRPTIVETLTETEQTAWSIALALDIPFHHWVTQLRTAPEVQPFGLPELSFLPD